MNFAPSRVDPCPEPLVHEFERGLDRRPARCGPPEDLADGLDRFNVGVDRELEPGTLDGDLRPGAGRPGHAQPSPSFSRMPAFPDPTDSPASSA